MSTDIREFSLAIETRLSKASKEPHWEHDDVKRYMSEYAPRRIRFEALAARLIETVIRPRMEIIAGVFDAKLMDTAPHNRCGCYLEYCERFPVSAKIEFSVEPDARFENAKVCYELFMMPIFVKFDAHDKLTLPINDIDDENVAEWVEQRLLEFVDTYLRIDRGEPEFDEDVATDPICGMRIRRSEAVAKTDYRGHAYYFCAKECQRQFVEDPKRYVRVVTF